MHVKRWVVVALAAALTAAGISLGSAAAASAETWVAEPCQEGSYTVVNGDYVYLVYPASPTCGGSTPGADFIDEFVNNGTLCEQWVVTASEGPVFYISGGGLEFTITADATATLGSAPIFDYDAVADCGWTGYLASASASASNPIPDWVQAYARDGMDAPCEDGWNPSWQKWAEDISGGWVCTRSIPSLG